MQGLRLGIALEIRQVQKGVFRQADIHKGRVHAGQNVFHPALVDVVHQPVFNIVFQVILHQPPVFHKPDLDMLEQRGDD